MDFDADIDVERATRFMMASPQARALGLRVLEAERGVVTLELPWRADLVGDVEQGGLAGGAVTALIDHALATAVLTARKGGGPTLDMRVDQVRLAAPGAAATCEASCYRLSGDLAFTRAVAWDADREDPIAVAQAVFAIPERRRA